MLGVLKQLDELLRGDRTNPELLRQGRLEVRVRVFVPVAVALGASYGFFMGWYAIFGGRDRALLQALASTVKLPALFLLTLLVTFPSLYVFNALIGGKLGFAHTARLLVAAVVVNLAVAASLGPILAFFTVSTTSYPFMILLNVALLGIAGVCGLGFLLKTLRTLARTALPEPPPVVVAEPPDLAGLSPKEAEEAVRRARAVRAAQEAQRAKGLAERDASAGFIFRVWVVIYALVGAQMGWLLRPFIGSPGEPFQVFRPREGNFFSAVAGSLRALWGM